MHINDVELQKQQRCYKSRQDAKLTEGSDLGGWYWFFSRLTWSSVVLR